MGEIARPDVVRLVATETVAESLERLRGETIGERVIYFYVTEPDGRLAGVVPTRRLLLSGAAATVGSIMVHPVLSVRESEPFGKALETLTARRLLALPVVDEEGRLRGVLDATAFTKTLVDLERRDAAEEIFQLAGVQLEEERHRTVPRALANRFPWLLANIAGGLIAAYISQRYDSLLHTVVALAFFVPMLLTIAESVAMQSVTLSLNRLQAAGSVVGPGPGGMFREIRVGLLLGAAAGFVVGLIGMAWLHLLAVAGVVAGGIMAAGAIGAGLGFFIPRLVRRWKLNPMVASGPVTLAITDIGTLACYFGLAAAVLG